MGRSVKPKTRSSSATRRRAHPREDFQSEYLATDLEVVSKRSLDAYRDATRGKEINRDEITGRGRVILLGVGGRVSPRESSNSRINRNVMAAVRYIRGLSPKARAEWDAAATRTVDIGIQAGHQPDPLEIVLELKTIKAVTDIGARVQVTMYAAPQTRARDD